MRDITITEALNEIKLTFKKISSAAENAKQYVAKPKTQIDPLGKDGASRAYVDAQLDSIASHCDNLVKLRAAIADSNAKTQMTILGDTRTIQEWLKWKSEAGPKLLETLRSIQATIYEQRTGDRANRTRAVYGQAQQSAPEIEVQLDERKLLEQIQTNEEKLTMIDGQLNLLNAQTRITIE